MQKKKAVSLIVLVITVIVMIILAGAIVLSLNNTGIIDKAKEAVSQSNLATVKQVAQLGWAEAYAGGARTKEELQAGVDKLLATNKVDMTKFKVWVTTKGVTVKPRGEEATWVQDGMSVTNGKITLQVGDKFEYDETNDGTVAGIVDTDWQVLGANENGELLILSTKAVKEQLIIGDNTNAEASENSWINYKANLDAPCLAYGQGEDAVEARSIDIDDVIRLEKIDGNQREITFKYNGTTTPDYIDSNGVSGKVTSNDPITGDMYVIKGNQLTIINDIKTGKVGDTIVTMQEKVYDDSLHDKGNIINEMIDRDTNYWLADEGLNWFAGYTASDNAIGDLWYIYHYCGHGRIELDKIGADLNGFYDSGSRANDVRAVVALASDIIVSGNSTDGWKY